MSALQASFKFAMGNPILPGMVTVGKFDGTHPALACGTVGNRVFVYSPHSVGDNSSTDVRFLNINRIITSLSCGRLGTRTNDVLLVGSPSHIMAYDVEKNQDMFFKEVTDGVLTIGVGAIESVGPAQLCFVGGNCSIQGFDDEGEEKFWTVASDNVRALKIHDIDKDGKNEVISGTDDFEIRVLRGDGEVVAESTQTDKVTFIQCFPGKSGKFAYALENGTVGVYEMSGNKLKRKWRVKSKHRVCAMAIFDMQQTGNYDVIIGWSNGRIEVRQEASGEVVFKDSFDAPLAGVLVCDLRLDGREQVLACSQDGEVRGYVAIPRLQARPVEEAAAEEEELIAQLSQTKSELQYELKSYEDNLRHMRTSQMKQGEGQLLMLPVDTRISCQWRVDEKKRLVRLAIATNNTMVIRGVVVFADRLFDGGESLTYVPKEQLTEAQIPICPTKDVSCDLNLKVFIGPRNSDIYHVVEQSYALPRFSMYAPLPSRAEQKPPASRVSFVLGERAARVVEWLNTSFNISYDPGRQARSLSIGFNSLRDDGLLWIQVEGDRVEFRTDNIELAGDLVQDLAEFTHCEELSSSAEFPAAMAQFKEVLRQVDEYNASRLALAAGSAELVNEVKDLVVRAEDLRLLGEMGMMARSYTQIMSRNRELLAEHKKRAANQEVLVETLKSVNQMIQRAARLRVGAEKAAVIAACRDALKAGKLQVLFEVIQSGKAG
mmetsp:Transcript_63574/g.170112  ORF Transcript_63574/g.170112 Transcript_63574/m.170112 type:complete len:716 (-) Transcript_63574:13-2160(-)